MSSIVHIAKVMETEFVSAVAEATKNQADAIDEARRKLSEAQSQRDTAMRKARDLRKDAAAIIEQALKLEELAETTFETSLAQIDAELHNVRILEAPGTTERPRMAAE